MRFEQCESGVFRVWLDEEDIKQLSRSFGNSLFSYANTLMGFISMGVDEEDLDHAEVNTGSIGITLSDVDRESFPRIITREFIQPVGCIDDFGGSITIDLE